VVSVCLSKLSLNKEIFWIYIIYADCCDWLCSNISMPMASDELASKLQHRTDVITSAEEGKELPEAKMPSSMVFNPYTEFKEFSRKEIQHFQKMFTL